MDIRCPRAATDVLMQALGRHGSRPAHVHFFIEAPGFRTLTTQINFGDDPFAADDFAFGTREGLLPVPNRQGDTAHIGFDFVLQHAHDKARRISPPASALTPEKELHMTIV
jgi:catechol 1,2-dioxygenase